MSGTDRRLTALEKRIARVKMPASTPSYSFESYRDDPVRFRAEVLGYESATRRSDGGAYQDEILASVVTEPRVALLAGHGVGKTRTLGSLAVWWTVTRPYSRVVIVAPQYDRQVRGVIFAELAKLVRRARIRLPLDVRAGSAVVEGFGAEWGCVGVPATEPDRLEGFHADGGLLLLLDETKGIDSAVYDALQGALTGGDDSRLVVASTPGGSTGPFYRCCTDTRGMWKVHRLSSEDSSLVSPRWCEDRRVEWGRDSALYQTRVQGTFADEGDGQLFPLSILEAATERDGAADGAVTLGVDVARSVSGDCNCIAVAHGGRVERIILWRSPDLMATVARVVHEVAVTNPKPSRILVDAGGVGGGVVDRLKQLRYPCEELNFGGAADDPSRFRNRRAEIFWTLRELLDAGKVSLPDDDELIADLSALRFTFDQSGKIVLESKDDARRRLGRSPDRADAVALAITASVAGAVRAPIVAPYAVPIYRPPWDATATADEF
jgi:phage terminase large subunit